MLHTFHRAAILIGPFCLLSACAPDPTESSEPFGEAAVSDASVDGMESADKWRLNESSVEADSDSSVADQAGTSLESREMLMAPAYRHMASLSRGSIEPVELRLDDERQWGFLLARLAQTGKTRKTVPALFAVLDEIRVRQLTQSITEEEEPTPSDSESDLYAHLVTDVAEGAEDTVSTSVHTTVEEGSEYTYLDVQLYDEEWNAIGPVSSTEQVEFGMDVGATGNGILPPSSDVDGEGLTSSQRKRLIQCLSYVITKPINGVSKVTQVWTSTATPTGKITLEAPIEDTSMDGRLTVCLDRSWLYDWYDCDYKMEGTNGNIVLPLKGSLDIGAPIVADVNGRPGVAAAQVSLSMLNSGGACGPTNFNFASSVQFASGSTSKVVWDIPSVNFGSRCFKNQEQVKFSFLLRVTATINGRAVPVVANVTSGTSFPLVDFAYSCVAEGTLVRLADGSLVAVESLTQDQQVIANDGGTLLSIRDKSVGIEGIPMVRVIDHYGHNLLLTESHPVVLDDGRVIQAQNLEVGDLIGTEVGPAMVENVNREMFEGKVYNLMLGTEKERRTMNANETTFFANGIRIGDAQIQQALDGGRLPRRFVAE